MRYLLLVMALLFTPVTFAEQSLEMRANESCNAWIMLIDEIADQRVDGTDREDVVVDIRPMQELELPGNLIKVMAYSAADFVYMVELEALSDQNRAATLGTAFVVCYDGMLKAYQQEEIE